MTRGARLALLLAILAVALVGAWVVVEDVGRQDDSAGGPAPEAASAGANEDATLAARRRDARKDARMEDSGPAPVRAGRRLEVVRGLVEGADGPVVGARVTVRASAGRSPDGLPVPALDAPTLEAVTDARGQFRFEGLPAGAYEVRAVAADGSEARTTARASADAPWVVLRVGTQYATRAELDVLVVDGDKRPVAGAEVECAGEIGVPPRRATADARGIATFDDLEPRDWAVQRVVTARGPGGVARAVVRFEPPRGKPTRRATQLVLAAPGSLEVRVRAPAGESSRGTVVDAVITSGFSWTVGVVQSAAADDAGVARFADLPAGAYGVLAHRSDGLRQDFGHRPPRWPGDFDDWEPLEVKVESGEKALVDVALVRGGALRGRVVRDPDGTAVAGARVTLHQPQGNGDGTERVHSGGVHLWRFDSAWPEDRRHPLTHRVVTTDAEGRYQVDGLLPGSWRVLVAADPGLSFDRIDPVEVSDSHPTELLHRLRPAGTLEVVMAPFRSYGLESAGKDVAVAFYSQRGASGAASIPGLAAGRWDLVALHSDPRFAPIPLASFEIRAGETTYLDASNTGNDEVRIRLLAGGRPAAGALVDATFGSSAMTADSAGRCSWRRLQFGPEAGNGREGETPFLVRFDESSPWLFGKLADRQGELDVIAPEGSLTVRTLDRRDRPSKGARVSLVPVPRHPPPEGWTLSGRGTLPNTDAAGVLRAGNLPAGSYSVQVRFPDSRALAVGVAEVADGPVEVVVHEPPSKPMRIRVLDVEGRPQAGALVSINIADATREERGMSGGTYHPLIQVSEPDLATGADGVAEVPGVPYGLAGIYVSVPGAFGGRAAFSARAGIDVGTDFLPEVVLRLTPSKEGR